MAMTAVEIPAPPARPLAEVVLYAEFDLTKGSTLRASYPRAFAHYSPEFFADIMLPEGVHNREEDFTVFFLNRQNAHAPPSDTADSTANESQEAPRDEVPDPLQSFMYCLSVVRTTHDTAARRGAKVTAVALCSTHKSCFALKEVLNLAVLKIVGAKSETESEAELKELHEVVNAVDVSGVRGLSSMERRLMKRTISSTGRAAANHEDAERLEKALFFRAQALWDDIPIPLQFKICSTDDQHDDGTLTQLLQTFGDQTMVLFNALLTGQRVIMLGYNRPAGEVCNFVLATSSLVCPPLFGLIHRQYPYANLTDLGFLSTPGYIAGVTNPMFKTKREWWDVLCDISTGEVFVSAPVEKEDYDASDRNFVLEVLDGVAAGYDEEWLRCMFEEYTRKNIVDIVLEKTGVDLRRHIRSLQGDMVVLDDTLVEKIYSDFATLLNTEPELQEFLSYLLVLRGGLQTIAQGIFYPSIGVKHNTVVLLKRLEEFPSTASSMRRLNAFLLMSYQRIHDIVNPDTRS
ncbi:hypothetical protein PF010_g11144 [Phytophthora fragariae]|uniref:UDENN domain-containing protein n=1 Tax=Phytophthora fragariae TaxID=53985 RepID=A0A6A3KP75_9STRA|nr:hypothetical protein PF011_g10483 [Phytophthora fragariae]KAE9110494.1 hypothetical protein PF010_g11144 [Phytophthora fragariae]KAE9232816.1 hypothetical protein PF004_g9820 [Phytophthora fragariae]